MAYGMVNSLMDDLIDKLPQYVREGLNVDDPYYLETIEKAPLQDDPTLRATFLCIEPDMDADEQGYRQPVGSTRKNKLRHADAAPQHEIGVGWLMINYFKITGWTPQASSKQAAYESVEILTRRLERAVQVYARHHLPEGVTTDDGHESTRGLLQVFNLNGTTFNLVGGESEWYGKVYLNFAIYSRVDNQFWHD